MEEAHKRQVEEMKEEMSRWLRSEKRTDQSTLVQTLEEKLKEQEANYDTIISDLKWQLKQRDMDELGKSRSSMNEMELYG